ncbi:MAG: penicillin-binding protein 2 [Geminicoccaceae bacterium]|nr:penicillin-binding protein 2 [Geminicoccaceae bacterium]MCB9942027.1 penicillin-binding protein 2 [Geminicoccaceae bacterium]
MYQEAERLRSFTRRAIFTGAAQSALFLGIGARLYYLQVSKADDYALLAEDNRVNQRLLIPPRGRIYDIAGRPIARNVPTYRIRVIRERTRDLRRTLERLATLVELKPEAIDEVVRQAQARRAFVPVDVREGLTWEEVSRIAVRAPELPGIVVDSSLLRDYPDAEVLAHVLGYVGPVNERELKDDPDPLLKIPEFRIGKNGIEKTYDHLLRGRAGSSRVEVNAVGRAIRELARDEGDSGKDLNLSIDIELQQFCFNRLAGEKAAGAVVVDVHTGAVLAMASIPTFDPRAFNNGLSQTVWREWRDNPQHPLVNKCIRGQYPPGSTFKMVTALAALESGVVTPNYEAFCPGYMRLGRARFHCWKQWGHGRIALNQALAQSCDVYFYDVARRAGVDAIAAMANKLGLGHKLDIDVPGERGGLIPTREWKLENIGEPWQKGETLVAGIGQGFVLATPLQLAIMTARLCNGGKAVKPWFVRPTEVENVAAIDISQGSLHAVLRGMHEVINGNRGTARGARLDIPGITMAGKTGTSQVRRITRSERAQGLHKLKNRPWEELDHALFVCFAPYENPRYAVSVIVEHGESGSKTAAPIAKDIMTRALELDPIGREKKMARA